MIILFTGHRNKFADEGFLEEIRKKYPKAQWLHGGAEGFDRQVHEFAKLNGIETLVSIPNYQVHGKNAPLIRNDLMVAMCDIVVALYDERQFGGTFYTINRARKAKKEIIFARFASKNSDP